MRIIDHSTKNTCRIFSRKRGGKCPLCPSPPLPLGYATGALSFLPEEEKLAVISKVEKEAVELASECAHHSGCESLDKDGSHEPPQKRCCGDKHLMALISDVIHQPNQCQSRTEKALTEARRYIDGEPVDEDPLLWWSKTSPRCPNLTVLAKKY